MRFLVARIAIARLKNPCHLIVAEWQRRRVLGLWPFQTVDGIARHPLRVERELKERPQALEIFRRVERPIVPGRLELAQHVNGQLEPLKPLMRAPGQEASIEQVFVLADHLGREIPRFLIRDELGNGFGSRGDLDLDDTDFARRFPAAHELGSRLSGPKVERLFDVFAAQRSLDPDRALAGAISPRLFAVGVLAGWVMSPEKRQHSHRNSSSAILNPILERSRNAGLE